MLPTHEGTCLHWLLTSTHMHTHTHRHTAFSLWPAPLFGFQGSKWPLSLELKLGLLSESEAHTHLQTHILHRLEQNSNLRLSPAAAAISCNRSSLARNTFRLCRGAEGWKVRDVTDVCDDGMSVCSFHLLIWGLDIICIVRKHGFPGT